MPRHLTDQFSPVLNCFWKSWRYAGRARLVLDVSRGQVPEIRGTVRTAEALLHGVERVEVTAAGEVVRVFERWGKGWRTTFDKGEGKQI